GGGGHGGGGHGGGGHGGGNINVGVNISNQASAYSNAYASAYSRSYGYAAQGDVYGGSQSQSIAYGSSFAGGGGYGGGYGCASPCGVTPVGYTVAPYGPGGPFITYTVIDSRRISREAHYESASYGYPGGQGGGYDCVQTCEVETTGGDHGYGTGYQTGYSSQDCTDCYVPREPAPLPPYQPQADPYYVPSYPEQGCYRGGSGECG
ncbi:MAG TPA: hypothetical protein PLE81_08955, partial [Brevundimonas sp.]|nr:hypothetical protein [Brevundimonas sp.]